MTIGRVGDLDQNEVVLAVDERDRPLGEIPKLLAHATGRLHRAVSVMLFDDAGRVLLQRRAAGKYHSGGLWSNTCCGHPRAHESVLEAGHRRLMAEMGIAHPTLHHVGSFAYTAPLRSGMVEHEIDHVLTGEWIGDPIPDRDEVDEWRWAPLLDLKDDLARRPLLYTAWLGRVLDMLPQFRALSAAAP